VRTAQENHHQMEESQELAQEQHRKKEQDSPVPLTNELVESRL
jgi:hypothetical protein